MKINLKLIGLLLKIFPIINYSKKIASLCDEIWHKINKKKSICDSWYSILFASKNK